MRIRTPVVVAGAAALTFTAISGRQADIPVESDIVVLPWRTLDIHGPIDVSYSKFATVQATTGSDGGAESTPQPVCTDASPCFSSDGGSDGVGQQTPVPKQWFAHGGLKSGAMDTTIAVGKTFVLVSSRNYVAVYDKSGTLIGSKYSQLIPGSLGGSRTRFVPVTFPNPFAIDPSNSGETGPGLFDFLTDDINADLNLPAGLPPNIDVASGYGIDTYYDNRVLYDAYRDRFWVVAIAQPTKLRNYVEGCVPGPDCPSKDACVPGPDGRCGAQVLLDYPALAVARRGYIVAAVTKTADPRDGFYLYWWDADIKDGTCDADLTENKTYVTLDDCTDALTFGWQGGDYPTLAISEKYLLVTDGVGYHDAAIIDKAASTDNFDMAQAWANCKNRAGCGFQNGYAHMVAAPADALANGMQCSFRSCPSTQGWHFAAYHTEKNHITDQEGQARGMRPVMHHGSAPFGYSFFANNYVSGDNGCLVVWALTTGGSTPSFIRLTVGVNPFAVDNWTLVTTSSLRNQLLYATWHHCEPDSTPCERVVRVVRFDVLNPSNTQYVDESFGHYSAIDDNSNLQVFGLIDYWWPAIEATKNGDMAIVFNRYAPALPSPLSSINVPQEVRFSVRPSAGPIRPSRLVKAGEALRGFDQPDTVGIAVDPFDDLGIWMAHIYADAEINPSRIVVAKVFGKVHADIAVRPIGIFVFASRAFGVVTTVSNYGDSTSNRGRIAFFLSRDAVLDPGDTALTTTTLEALEPGASMPVAAAAWVGAQTAAGTYYLLASIAQDLPASAEYSIENNVALGSPEQRICVPAAGAVKVGPC